MKVEEWLQSKSDSGKIVLGSEELFQIQSYLTRFEIEELSLFCLEFIDYSKMAEIVEKAKFQDTETDRELAKGLILIKFIQALRENRELIREIFVSEEFSPD